MYAKNYELHILGSIYDAVQFGAGPHQLVLIPGLEDGIATVRGKALACAALFRRFGKQYTVTIVSRKRDLEENADTASMAKDQALAMEALGIRRAHVLGIGLGAMIAQHLAADYPQMADRLVLASAVPSANDQLRRNVSRWVDFVRTGAWMSLAVDMTEKNYPLKKSRLLRPAYPILAKKLSRMDTGRFIATAQACALHDAEDSLDRITAPTLILGSQQDRILGAEGAHLLHRYIGGSVLRIYADQGHRLEADDFSDSVLSFLAEKAESSQVSPG